MLASVQIIVKIRLFSILLMLRYVHEYIVMDSKNSWLWKEFRVFRYEREDTEYIPNEFIQCILNAGPLNFTRMCMEMRSVLTTKQYKKKTQYISSLTVVVSTQSAFPDDQMSSVEYSSNVLQKSKYCCWIYHLLDFLAS